MDGEKIRQFAIESFGPNVGIGPRVDQLRIHPHPVARSAHRAFEDVGDAERFADLAQVARAGPVLLHGSPADHFQVRDPGEAGENVVVHAVGEECVLAVVTQVFKRKNGDAFFRPAGRTVSGATSSSVRLIPDGVMS